MRRNILAFCTVSLLIFVFACQEQATEPKVGNPTLTILTPSAGDELYGVVHVQVFGHDVEDQALDRIVYYVNDIAQYTDPNPSQSSPSSTWEWNSELMSDGEYDFKVVGYDHVGRSTEASNRHTVSNADAASGVVRSNESGTITTRKGASVRVPLGGVPLDEEGENATMVFSIARDTLATAPPPVGETRISQYYRFTPGGFIFRFPVEVTLPLMDGVDVAGREVNLYRINPTSGEIENFAGSYDEEFETVSAQTYELSTWFATARTDAGADPQGFSCINVSSANDDWVTLCVESYLLSFPTVDQLFLPENGLTAAYGRNQFGWDETGHWFLPQGQYSICMQRLGASGVWESQTRTITLNQPANRTWDGAVEGSVEWSEFVTDGSIAMPVIGTCPCIPEASVPVGTGDVQVTLQWFSDLAIDLDLWVYEPSGERCFYGHSTTATGGRLDRDNLCGNYQNGTPENIFWRTAPPGEYTIWVDWFSECGNGQQQMPFNVRLVNLADVRTFDRTLQNGQTLEVAQFRVTSTGIQIAPPGGMFRSDPPQRVAKEDVLSVK
jgi:hypothetical protein